MDSELKGYYRFPNKYITFNNSILQTEKKSMANHNRKGPKSTRSGCLMCKPHKRQGSKLEERQKHSDNVRFEQAKQQVYMLL